jgi:hypothetical protein
MLEFEFGSPASHNGAGEQASKQKASYDFATVGESQSTDTTAGPNERNPFSVEVSQLSDAHSATSDETGKKNEPEVDLARYAERPSNSQLTRAQARQKCDAALDELCKGKPFEQVVKQFLTGANAEGGGWQPGIRPESVADPKTAEALRQLPEGSTSGVIETEYAYRIVKVACRMPAAWRSFEEVAPTIRRQIRQEAVQRALEELYSRTTIESPYIDELGYGQPATCPPKSEQTDAFAE